MKSIIFLIVFNLAVFAFYFLDKKAAVKASYDKGYSAAERAYQERDIKTLTAVITNTEALVNHAERVSHNIEVAMAAQTTADQKTTQEIQRALSRNANQRVNCQFDDGVMQQLTTARDRANKAAASGVGYALPTGTSAP